jgi:hypothetical protein
MSAGRWWGKNDVEGSVTSMDGEINGSIHTQEIHYYMVPVYNYEVTNTMRYQYSKTYCSYVHLI